MSRNKNLNSTKIAICLSQIKVILESNAEASPPHPTPEIYGHKEPLPMYYSFIFLPNFTC